MWIIEKAKNVELTTLPRDIDPEWIVSYLRDRAHQHQAFEVALTGEYEVPDYQDFRAYRVRRGFTLRPEDVAMNRVARISEIIGVHYRLQRSNPQLAGLNLQVSQPGPLDLALFVEAGGLAVAPGLPWSKALRRPVPLLRALRHLPVYQEAVRQEVASLTAEHNDVLTWQVESPICTLAMLKASTIPGFSTLMAPALASHLTSVFSDLAAVGARATFHLCYGDYAHKALLVPRSLRPLVQLLNALGSRLDKAGIRRPMVHLPCAYGGEAAPLRADFYKPLAKLDAGWTELVAGVASVDEEQSVAALRLFERAACRKAVAVAAACGFGRQDCAQAELVVHAMTTAARS